MSNKRVGVWFEVLSEADIAHAATGAMAGPRCVIDPVGGGVVCTYMQQSKLGSNDFVPMLTRSDRSRTAWSAPRAVWPELRGCYSIFCNLSRTSDGTLHLFGSRTVAENKGESFWCERTRGLKANDLIWASSEDGGETWSDPQASPWPCPGSAEAPGPMLLTRETQRFVSVYSPYNVMDEPTIQVERNRVIAVLSDDRGATWRASDMLRFDDADAGGAEAWIIQLTDGRLLGTAWQTDLSDRGRALPNCFAISEDVGSTWSATRSTGVLANTTALTPLNENCALFITVRRGRDDAGIWLSIVQPTADDFGIQDEQRVWSSASPESKDAGADLAGWTDFTYGEPCVSVLSDGTLFMVFWYMDVSGAGIRGLHLRPRDTRLFIPADQKEH